MANESMTAPIAIIGGGPVGLVLALSLHKNAIPVTVLEAMPQGGGYQDGRALALSDGTRQVLMQLGVWSALAEKATAINSIHISQQKGFGRSILKAEEQGLPALGYVVAYGDLMRALDVQAQACKLSVVYQAPVSHLDMQADGVELTFTQADEKVMHTLLAVIADGGRSLNAVAGVTREVKEYGHDALVGKVVCEQPHNNIAYERFTPKGPMALLPNGPRDFSLVWTGEKAYVDGLLALDEPVFLAQLHEAFGDRVGKFLKISKRMSFPLKLAKLSQATPAHLVVIGNAAQTMHPVAGQGFNVGIRDAWDLAKLIQDTPAAQWGTNQMLSAFKQARAKDTERGLMFTDALVNVFSNDLVGVGILRGLGLGMLSMMPLARRFLVNKMSYGR